MSLDAIRALSRQAAVKAASEKRTPYVFWDAADVDASARSLPNLGSYRPYGWSLVDTYFVDSSGMGQDEPAMTFDSFKRTVKGNIEAGLTYGYGLIEVGQFQVKVGVFHPTGE